MSPRQLDLPSGGRLELLPLVDREQAADIERALEKALDWEQREIVLFGKRVMQPRLVAWCGAVPYRYSGQTLAPRPCPDIVADLLERVAAAAGSPFNHVLGNWYRHGSDSMGYHSDDEPELGGAPTVASLSLGATRRFVLRSRASRREPPHRIDLEPGVLLIMRPPCQARYRHALPRTARPTGARISLTFRHVIALPGQVPPRARGG